MAPDADGSESNDSREAGTEAGKVLVEALQELAARREEEARALLALASDLQRNRDQRTEPLVARFEELETLPPPDWASRVLGVPLATAVAAMLQTAPFRTIARRADPWRVISRLRTVVERAPIRHSDRYPRRWKGFITWRSKYGARKHELRLPPSQLGQVAWNASRADRAGRLRLALTSTFEVPESLRTAFAPVLLSGVDLERELTETSTDVLLLRLQDLAAMTERSPEAQLREAISACEEARAQVLLWIDLRRVEVDTCRHLQLPRTLAVFTESVPSREALRLVGIEAHVVPGLDLSDGVTSGADLSSDPATTLQRIRAEDIRRTVALTRLTASAGLPNVGTGARLVSTICVSHRIERIEACVETFRRQTYPHKEFVFVANSDQLSDEWLDRFAALGSDLVLLRTDASVSLGESLNRARSVARGELWTKLDDDDHYGAAYLADQVEALRRSGATVVGKGTYFTYVEGDDTVYVASHAPENSFSERFVHGGTILADRHAVEEIEFLPVRRGTDSLFLQQCKLLGHRIYSADRYNFVYMRYKAEGHHTYDVSNRELSREHVFVRKGLDFRAIDI